MYRMPAEWAQSIRGWLAGGNDVARWAKQWLKALMRDEINR
jgi:hypothetical protein